MERVVFDERQIAQRVRALAEELDRAYRGSRDLVLVGVLRGALYFLSDLSRAMRTAHRLDFMEFASYHGTDRETGRLVKGCTDALVDADVVLIDEVFDSGETIKELRACILDQKPRSLRTCVLLWKHGLSSYEPPEFVGFRVGPDFLVGYGLDHNQQLRHLPYVAVLESAPAAETRSDGGDTEAERDQTVVPGAPEAAEGR